MLGWLLSVSFSFLTRNTPCGIFRGILLTSFTGAPPPVKQIVHVINMTNHAKCKVTMYTGMYRGHGQWKLFSLQLMYTLNVFIYIVTSRYKTNVIKYKKVYALYCWL